MPDRRRKTARTKPVRTAVKKRVTKRATARRVNGRAIRPTVRPLMRSGRGVFLRSLRGRIASVKHNAYETMYRERVLKIVDDAIENYKGR